jgi:fatty acid desaturase
MSLQSISDYARALRPALPPDVFRPAPGRLLWLVLHVTVAGLGIAVIASGASLPLAALLSLPIGLAFAGMAFVAHEALHGAIVRGPAARLVVGGIGFLPFLISPRHWVGWHNRMHHGNTTMPGRDPDMYPTLDHYRVNRMARFADRLSLGGRRLLGFISLLVGLVVQSMEVLLVSGPRARYLPPRQRVAALAETAAAIAFWAGLGAWLGFEVFLFGWLVPLGIGSVVVMAHIVTNHGLSRMTDVNDPLANSLSVTVPRWFSIYTLQFGLHVEHHMFPAMSARHAPSVRALIRERWGDRYRSMPLPAALRRMFNTGRVYKNATTLCDPLTGSEAPTL